MTAPGSTPEDLLRAFRLGDDEPAALLRTSRFTGVSVVNDRGGQLVTASA